MTQAAFIEEFYNGLQAFLDQPSTVPPTVPQAVEAEIVALSTANSANKYRNKTCLLL